MDLIIDVETTGLPNKRQPNFRDLSAYDNARVVSFAWIVLDHNSRIETSYHIIKPNGFTIPSDSIKIHGITNEFAKQVGIPMKECIRHLKKVFEKYPIKTLVSHNISFDFGVLLSEFYRHYSNDMVSKFFKAERYCTMKFGKEYLKVKKFPKLTELYKELTKKDLIGAHNAAADTEACCCCYKILRQKQRRTSVSL